MPKAKPSGSGTEPKKRSRGGCHQCKARKIKCSEEKPKCANCQKVGEDCDYSIKLQWGGRSKKDQDAFSALSAGSSTVFSAWTPPGVSSTVFKPPAGPEAQPQSQPPSSTFLQSVPLEVETSNDSLEIVSWSPTSIASRRSSRLRRIDWSGLIVVTRLRGRDIARKIILETQLKWRKLNPVKTSFPQGMTRLRFRTQSATAVVLSL